jgi:TonB family protein
MKTRVAVAALALLAPGSLAPVFAQSTTVAVAAPPSLAAWSKRVFRDLDRVLVDPSVLPGRSPETGIVAVKFNCSERGAPAGVALYKSSGSHRLDNATVRAVQRIATLHPLPARMMHDQQFVVRVLFANSEDSARQQVARMQDDAAKTNAWFGKDPTQLAYLEIAPGG